MFVLEKTKADTAERKEKMNKKIGVGTAVYCPSWGKYYRVAEFNPEKANTEEYIIMKRKGQPPWYCDKMTWERLLKNVSAVIVDVDAFEKRMFPTLCNYESGFFGRADKIEADSYRAESKRIKDRLFVDALPLDDSERIEDIIYEEQQKAAKAQLRASFTNDDGTAEKKAQGYWCAVEHIKCSLIDSKPL